MQNSSVADTEIPQPQDLSSSSVRTEGEHPNKVRKNVAQRWYALVLYVLVALSLSLKLACCLQGSKIYPLGQIISNVGVYAMLGVMALILCTGPLTELRKLLVTCTGVLTVSTIMLYVVLASSGLLTGSRSLIYLLHSALLGTLAISMMALVHWSQRPQVQILLPYAPDIPQ